MNDILKGLAGTILITGVALAVLLSFQNKDKKEHKENKISLEEFEMVCYLNCSEKNPHSYESFNSTIIALDSKKEEYKANKIKEAQAQRVAKMDKLREQRVAEERARKLAERRRKEALEKAKARKQQEMRKQSQKQVANVNSNSKDISVSRSGEYKGVNQDLGVFNVSWYGSDCVGCSGQTSSGVWVNKSITYNGYGVAAADWNVLPPYSIIEVQGYGRYIVLDRGGAIKNKRLDLLTSSEAKSNEYGRQHLNVTVLRWGKEIN
ncbi:3D domain-containing protein [Sporosarcina sp. FSL W7-1283]|uniref:3D domain-containing protein n=1 Tax=Sporosarcina sp. FSL W7-1283 TaxID=2921560 RepID=UPI0030F6368D